MPKRQPTRRADAKSSHAPSQLAPKLGVPGLMNARIDRARADGLTLRPLDETIAATRAWLDTLPNDRERHAGISRTRERELLTEFEAERGYSAIVARNIRSD